MRKLPLRLFALSKLLGKPTLIDKIEVGVGIHQLGRNRIEPLRRLPVALVQLRPEIARPPADRIGLEDLETAGRVLLPDFELRLFLENAQRRSANVSASSSVRAARAARRAVPSSPWPATVCCLSPRHMTGVKPAANSRRQHECTSDHGADHCCTPRPGAFRSECVQSVAFVGRT